MKKQAETVLTDYKVESKFQQLKRLNTIYRGSILDVAWVLYLPVFIKQTS